MKINKKRNHFSRQIKKPVEDTFKPKSDVLKNVIPDAEEVKKPKIESDDSLKGIPQSADSVKAALGGKSEGKIDGVWHKVKAGQVITGATRKEVREAAKAIA